MNRVVMNGTDRADINNHNDGSGGYHVGYYCAPSTIESFAAKPVELADSHNQGVEPSSFPPNSTPIASASHVSNPSSKLRSYSSTTTPYHKNKRYVLPPPSSPSSPPEHPSVQQSSATHNNTHGSFDPVPLQMLEDLRIGTNASPIRTTGVGLPFVLPTMKRKMSPTPSLDAASQSPGRRMANHKYWQQQQQQEQQQQPHHNPHPLPTMMKKPPPNCVTPTPEKDVFCAKKKKKPPSPVASLPTYKDYQESQLPFDRPQVQVQVQYSRDAKPPPPPPSSPPLFTPRQHTTKQPHSNGIRNSNSNSNSNHHTHERPGSLRFARFPSVPRAINVDLSFHQYETNPNANHSPLPPLSPISFSSSTMTMLKRTPIYPSKDSIEKQLSDLPPIESFFPTDPPFATSTATPTTNPTRGNNTRPATSASPKPLGGATARSAKDVAKSTASPSWEGKTSTALEHRPEKPLRINSHFPSQLQLQQQRERQQQQQQQQQPQHQQPKKHPRTTANKDDSHLVSLRPRPLPSGNGITNGIATGIDALQNTSRRASQPPSSFVPLAHYQEYDLQLSFPSSSSSSTTTTAATTTKPPTTREPNTARPQTPTNLLQKLSQSKPQVQDDTKPTAERPLSSPEQVVEVEIYPGVTQVLRGAQETLQATQRNFLVDCTCLICTTECSCIADAAYVICPTCLVVSPLEGLVTQSFHPHNSSNNNHNNQNLCDVSGKTMVERRWGVGLGFIPDPKER